MSTVWPLLAAFAASGAALAGSGLILALGSRAERAAVWLLAYAVGTLLGAATLHLIPEALELGATDRAMWLLLAGMLGFIALERAARWRHPHAAHHHAPAESAVTPQTAAVILWGDALHNFTDGIVLGVSFAASAEVGLVSALAIIAHEVPQEIGDFAILLSSGMPRRRAVVLNYLSAATVIPGALVAFIWSTASVQLIPWLLPAAAGGFIYIALSDLVPALHHRPGARAGIAQVTLIALGVATIWALGRVHP
jgi:zinc and cadmium transporter